MVTLTEEVQVNGDKLRQLRQERGWDWAQVARLSSLSVAQVQALESGSIECFYTLAIKNNAARKVARVLGAAESEVMTFSEKPDPLPVVDVSAPVVSVEAVEIQRNFRSSTPASTWLGYGVMSLGFVLCWVGYELHQRSSAPRPTGFMAAATATKSQSVTPNQNRDQPLASTTEHLPENAPVPRAETAVAVAQATAPSAAQAPSTAASSVATGAVTRPPSGEVEMAPASLNTDPACAFDGDNTPLEAAHPTKSGEKVSLMFHKAGLLCVQDSTGKVWKEDLKPWVGRTYMGKAPWKLYSPVLSQADVYFQGEKIKVGGVSSPAVTLTGKAFHP